MRISRRNLLQFAVAGGTLAELHPAALIPAAGPYTGSFVPASGQLAVLLPEAENCRQAAPALGHGAWPRRSGFDALVTRRLAGDLGHFWDYSSVDRVDHV
jgi:hypothetical protein